MNDYITGQRAHRRTLAAEYERAKEALRLARQDLREARAERIATVAGEVEGGDAGIAWTNEERAEADVDAAEEYEGELHDQLWNLDADIADAVACHKAELASYAA